MKFAKKCLSCDEFSEYMRRLLSVCILLVPLFVLSCRRTAPAGRDTIAFVRQSAAQESPVRKMIIDGAAAGSAGNIYIIGRPEVCSMVSGAFATCDIFENARGQSWSDGLKDFAGEEFDCIADRAYFPYTVFLSSGDAEALREACVRLSAGSLDTRCNLSVYDLDGNGEKVPAKMIILAEPVFAEYGKFDVDTLFSLCSCKVPVLSPEDLVFDAAFGGEKKYFNLGVLCDSLYSATGLYRSLFDYKVKEHDMVGARFFEAASCGEGSLTAFLSAYAESGRTEPLDALLVTDWSVSLDDLKAELKLVRDYKREESMLYRKLLADDFVILSAPEATMSACYRILREHSLFTHKIAQPSVREYTAIHRTGGEEENQFLLIPSENVQNQY